MVDFTQELISIIFLVLLATFLIVCMMKHWSLYKEKTSYNLFWFSLYILNRIINIFCKCNQYNFPKYDKDVFQENKCIFLDGRWGTGKTYYYENELKKILKNTYPEIIYISCFSFEKLDLIKEIMIKNNLLSRILSLNGFFSKFIVYNWDIITPYKKVIVLDDVERLHQSNQVYQDIIGIIEYLKNVKECKILLIGNMIGSNVDIFKEYMEKIVDNITVPPKITFNEIVRNQNINLKHRDISECIFNELNNDMVINLNIRLAIRAIQTIDYVISTEIKSTNPTEKYLLKELLAKEIISFFYLRHLLFSNYESFFVISRSISEISSKYDTIDFRSIFEKNVVKDNNERKSDFNNFFEKLEENNMIERYKKSFDNFYKKYLYDICNHQKLENYLKTGNFSFICDIYTPYNIIYSILYRNFEFYLKDNRQIRNLINDFRALNVNCISPDTYVGDRSLFSNEEQYNIFSYIDSYIDYNLFTFLHQNDFHKIIIIIAIMTDLYKSTKKYNIIIDFLKKEYNNSDNKEGLSLCIEYIPTDYSCLQNYIVKLLKEESPMFLYLIIDVHKTIGQNFDQLVESIEKISGEVRQNKL